MEDVLQLHLKMLHQCIIQSIIIFNCNYINSRFVEVIGTVNPDMTILEHRVGFLNDEFGIFTSYLLKIYRFGCL